MSPDPRPDPMQAGPAVSPLAGAIGDRLPSAESPSAEHFLLQTTAPADLRERLPPSVRIVGGRLLLSGPDPGQGAPEAAQRVPVAEACAQCLELDA